MARRTDLALGLTTWTREPAWITDAVHDVWQPRLVRVRQAWREAQRSSVLAGMRRAAVVEWSTDASARELGWGRAHGVEIRRLEARAQPAVTAPVPQGPVRLLYLAPGAPASALEVPACCLDFGARAAEWHDLTIPAYEGADLAAMPWEMNILLRPLGIAALPHQPCGPTCAASLALAHQLMDLLRVTHPDEAAWLEELLGLTVTWDARHGCVLVTTPLCRLSASTDPTDRVRLTRPGTQPAATPAGLTEAFPAPAGKKLTETRSFAAAIAPRARPDLNGFSTTAAMTAAHDRLVQAMVDGLPAETWLGGRILDLGCGDGTLLARLAALGATVFGIDAHPERAAAAIARLGAAAIRAGRLQDPACWPDQVDVVLLMPGRFDELGPTDRAGLADLLLTRVTGPTVCYTYNAERVDLTASLAAGGLARVPAIPPGATIAIGHLTRVAAGLRIVR